MQDEEQQTTVQTWLYNAKGESKLVDHPAGAEPPKGWFFAPPSGVTFVVEGASASSPATPAAMPGSVDARFLAVEARLEAVERLLAEMVKPAPAAAPASVVDEKPALLARAKEMGIEGVDGRTSADKLRALISEAEAQTKSAED